MKINVGKTKGNDGIRDSEERAETDRLETFKF